MKTAHTLILSSFAIVLPLSAASSVTMDVGFLYDSVGEKVPDAGGSWAVIYDTNGDGLLPGSLADHSSLTSVNTSSILGDFDGATIQNAENIAGDVIIASGNLNGLASSGEASFQSVGLNFEYPPSTAGRAYGFYWFPGIAHEATLPSEYQIGGIYETTASAGADIGMTTPADLVDSDSAFFEDDTLGIARFTAVAVPEPSTFALSALGLAALLRRRRK